MPPNAVTSGIHKVGDRWVAADSVESETLNDEVEEINDRRSSDEREQRDLRESIERLFDDLSPVGTQPEIKEEPQDEPLEPPAAAKPVSIVSPIPTKCAVDIDERIRAWQPATERELSIFSRRTPRPIDAETTVVDLPKSETTLSFDPSDLNPSRSASQVRRPRIDTSVAVSANANAMTPIEEGASTVRGPPTLISHVTFPKPAVAGQSVTSRPTGIPRTQPMEAIASEHGSSSVASHPTTMHTPHTGSASERSVHTAPTSHNPSVVAKLDKQSTELGSIQGQIERVQVDLGQIIMTLSTLVEATNRSSQISQEDRIPPVLNDKLSTIQMDVKAIENAIDFANLSTERLQQVDRTGEEPDKLVEVHSKLDAIAKLCEDVLASGQAVTVAGGALVEERAKSPLVPSATGLSLPMDAREHKTAGDEVAQIMADLVSTYHTPSKRCH